MSLSEHDNCIHCEQPNRCDEMANTLVVHCPNDDCSNWDQIHIPKVQDYVYTDAPVFDNHRKPYKRRFSVPI